MTTTRATRGLHMEVHGDGTTDLVMCNGLSQSTANWRALARQHDRYRWILFDSRGHGRSPIGETPYYLDGHVADLISIVDRSEAAKPVLMGFSHGARVALRAAATFPDRFAGLILISCAARLTVRRRAHVLSWQNCLRLGGVEALAWSSLPNIVGRKILEKYPDPSPVIKGTATRNNYDGLTAMFEGMATYPDAIDDAENIHIPTLVLRGDEDPLVEAADVTAFEKAIKHCQSETFTGCGHTLPLEETDTFLHRLDQFIAEL